MNRAIASALAISIFSLSWSAGYAIVTRHDIPDSRYLELADTVPAPIVLLTNDVGSADGMGTWIAPDWILTAAHVGEMIAVGDAVGAMQEYQVAQVIVHPAWPDTPVDVALIRISQNAEGVRAVEVCEVTDLDDEVVTFVGAGDSGTGKTGPTNADGKMRAARNAIVFADEYFVTFDFDAPRSGGAMELEGISGPGDSGGPAYLPTETGFCVLGVSSGQDSEASGGLEGRYGVVEYYSRVDVLWDWIKTVISP
ncbi:MAG: trypsin-like serine protease [Woeseiaceae bacterium]|nr:trypsin-like serine protease [Woeseiaceae bacterium]